ncbi:helix-turn-helix domain-containing protein [Raoultibacter phocaeensis]|uniref:helix-turn-helix domain-containing protein n=1 Tax=Raoultibacter phocaeensis TaxID=2479841 RepID=UPI00111A74A3|nr:helix-turn-helix transcriptional regulator [Raoultibacter phocaeensis]
MNVEIAQRLAELRRDKGYSQEELAEKLGLSRQAVSKWERAESSPDTGNLVALAKLYGVTLDELLRFDEDLEDDIRYEAQDRTVSAEAKAQAAAEKASVAAAQAAAAAAHVQAVQSAAAAQAHQAPAPSGTTQAHQAPAASGAVQGPATPGTGQASAFPPPTGEPYPYYTMPAQPPIPGAVGKTYGSGTVGQPPAPGVAPQPNPAQYPVGSKEWEDAYVEREMRSATGEINAGSKGSWSSFPYPILCVIVFLLAGFFWGIWHPAWIVFLTIPLYYYIAHVIDNDPNNRR